MNSSCWFLTQQLQRSDYYRDRINKHKIKIIKSTQTVSPSCKPPQHFRSNTNPFQLIKPVIWRHRSRGVVSVIRLRVGIIAPMTPHICCFVLGPARFVRPVDERAPLHFVAVNLGHQHHLADSRAFLLVLSSTNTQHSYSCSLDSYTWSSLHCTVGSSTGT